MCVGTRRGIAPRSLLAPGAGVSVDQAGRVLCRVADPVLTGLPDLEPAKVRKGSDSDLFGFCGIGSSGADQALDRALDILGYLHASVWYWYCRVRVCRRVHVCLRVCVCVG